MRERPIEIVRRIYEHWDRGDFTIGPEYFDPDLVFVMRPEFPDSGTYVGLEEVAGYTRGFLEPWDRITIGAAEMIEAGDSVVVAVTQRGRGTASRIEAELRYFHLWTFRGSAIIRFETFKEREEALAAVGLDA